MTSLRRRQLQFPQQLKKWQIRFLPMKFMFDLPITIPSQKGAQGLSFFIFLFSLGSNAIALVMHADYHWVADAKNINIRSWNSTSNQTSICKLEM